MFTPERLGTEWAVDLTPWCWVDIPGPWPGPLAWPSVTRGDYRKESILAFMTPLPWPQQVGRLSPWDMRVGEASPGGSVPKEAGLGLVAGTRPSFGGGTRPCVAREAGLAPSTRTVFWSLLLPRRVGAQ